MLCQRVLEFFVVVTTIVDFRASPLFAPLIQSIRDENAI